MCGQRFLKLLLIAMFSFAVLGPVSLAAAACHSHRVLPCGHSAFTGSVGRGRVGIPDVLRSGRSVAM